MMVVASRKNSTAKVGLVVSEGWLDLGVPDDALQHFSINYVS